MGPAAGAHGSMWMGGGFIFGVFIHLIAAVLFFWLFYRLVIAVEKIAKKEAEPELRD